MNEILSDPFVQTFLTDLVNGNITIATGIVWILFAAAFSIAGGAIGGVVLAGKDLGVQLAAMIGGLFGPAAVLPATFLGLLVLRLS
ncbi:MAG: hypothetical protein MUF49_20500 [Oculatellaceae cyanobacterium Prado106]|jgi:hypothetical protein|nr:hypothetical protein [Oculatellaceae cyanobacterium Prado106]